MVMLLERGAGKAVITMGAKGSVIGTQQDPIPQHIPVTPVEATDTTVCIRAQGTGIFKGRGIVLPIIVGKI